MSGAWRSVRGQISRPLAATDPPFSPAGHRPAAASASSRQPSARTSAGAGPSASASLPPRLAALEARIDELEHIKAEAVEAEDFVEAKAAKQLADSARRLLEVCTSIAQLEREKVVAVTAENFAHAKSAALAEWRAKLSDLDARKAAAVEGEGYEVASALQVEERALRARCEQLTELLAAKEQAVTADDFGLRSAAQEGALTRCSMPPDPCSPHGSTAHCGCEGSSAAVGAGCKWQ